jgi:cullin 1
MELIQKESGCSAMLRDNKTSDLERLFKLYSACQAHTIPPIANIFKAHMLQEGDALVNELAAVVIGDKDTPSNRKEVQAAELSFVRKVLDLQVSTATMIQPAILQENLVGSL